MKAQVQCEKRYADINELYDSFDSKPNSEKMREALLWEMFMTYLEWRALGGGK